jgi:hypothetical protein
MVDFNKKLKENQPPVPQEPNTTQAVSTVEKGGALALPPDMADMLLADAGSGMEKITKDDLAVPRLALLQQLSDQCKKTHTDYIPGAEPGDIYDNVMERVYKGEKGIDLVFVSFRPTNLEYITRKEGGGFVADHGGDGLVLKGCDRGPKGEWIPRDRPKNEIVPTKEYFAFLVDKDNGTWWPVMVSMSKSQAKYAQKLNTLLTQRKIEVPDPHNPGQTVKVVAPMFFHMWHCTTVPESNQQGEWMSWDILPGSDVLSLPFGKELYLAAREYKEKAQSGKINVAAPEGAAGGGGQSDADETAAEKLPF